MPTTISNEIFEDIKQAAIALWRLKEANGSHPNYIAEKVDRIQSLENIEDNWGAIVGLFDITNQFALLAHIKTIDAYRFYEQYLHETALELSNRS